jgi:putative FmdB family regulatory protein
MPIYAYKCSSCGHTLDVLQKISDAPLSSCPQCRAETLSKQLTAAGFQLRGSGWYATDFKNGSGSRSGTTAAKPGESKSGESDGASKSDGAAKSDGATKSEKSSDAAASGSCGHGGCSACS